LHFETMSVESVLVPPERITVVDDVVTKGATLLAAASRLAEAFPDAEVRAFAILRTMGKVEDIEKIFDPCKGVLTWRGSDVDREP
jgi:adenine/guanine phosphoribosyltransferase-like PRPP-binding protein